MGKDAITGGVSYLAGTAGTHLGTDWFGPEAGKWIGFGSGMAAGFLTYGGLNRIDSTFNLSGVHNIAKPPVAVIENAGSVGEGGKTHPVSGVKIDADGFPIFDSKFDVTLDASLHKASDYQQFKNATIQLDEAIQSNPTLKSQITEKQLQQISRGIRPDGFTWHHQDTGVLQLVDSKLHQQTGHIGSRSIWGGGNTSR